MGSMIKIPTLSGEESFGVYVATPEGDATAAVSESNESDNSVTRNVTW